MGPKGTLSRVSVKQWLGLALIALLGLLLWSGLRGLLMTWESQTLTLRQLFYSRQLHRSAAQHPPIHLIGIDNWTLRNSELKALLQTDAITTRENFSHVIRFLRRGQPKHVLLDVSFNAGRRVQVPHHDRLLIDSLQQANFISSTLVFSSRPDPKTRYDQLPPEIQHALSRHTIDVQGIDAFPLYRAHNQFSHLNPPFADLLLQTPSRLFAANAGINKINLDVQSGQNDDQSQLIRRWTPFIYAHGQYFPTLALGALLPENTPVTITPGGTLHWPGHRLDLGDEGMPLIKWYGHAVHQTVYPETSFGQVLISELVLRCQENPQASPACQSPHLPQSPPLRPEQFNHQYVLVGFTQNQTTDAHPTIYHHQYPGVYIVANMLDNALHNDFVRPAPAWLNVLATLMLPGLLLLAIWRFPAMGMSLLIVLSLGLGYFLLSLHAYSAWNLWLHVSTPLLALTTCFVGLYLYRYVQGEKKRQQLRFAFAKYVAPAVMQQIERNPEHIRLGGQRRNMTFLFSDIRNFTSFSENHDPEVVQAFLTDYFSVMNTIILHEYRGSINKLIGDAIMAYWGFPLDTDDHPYLAVCAAMRMREAMREWQADASRPPVSIGVGINTGEAMIGNVGSQDFMDFTVIGDAVNVASRLEGLNKEHGTTIIISESTYQHVRNRVVCRPLGHVTVKGKETAIAIFEPLHPIESGAPSYSETISSS